MNKINGKLSIFFEEPFWVGVFEKSEKNMLVACKVTFGAEPRNDEIYEFILKNYYDLKFSPSVYDFKERKRKTNPKRLQRDAKKETNTIGIGTKSQQALKLQQEERKLERQERSKKQREDEKKLRFDLKQKKRKQKHKGR